MGQEQADGGPSDAIVRAALVVGEPVGTAHPRLFGSFVEHLGRGVYGGIYEPGHACADEHGFRTDVLDLVRELGVTVVRYPGGNFVSGYDWRDGVGPVANRPRRLDLAWKSIETNEFGTDEFIAWCRSAGVEPMLALNLGLGTVDGALDLLEYANFPGGTALSDERAANGNAEPHAVNLWCLGNELDGPWQLGHRSAEDYAVVAATAANAMRMFDDHLELVAVGSSSADMPTFGEWERTVLARTVELVDYLSCHIYFYNDGDIAEFVRSSDKLHAFLTTIETIVAQAVAANPNARDVKISLDEWNVWNFRAYDELKPDRQFEVAPRILEEQYTAVDAVVVGSLLQTILAHANTVSIAALAQLVNVIGPIRTEPGHAAWRQTTFFPFAATARSAGLTVRTADAGTPDVLATVTEAPDGSTRHVYLTNRSLTTAHELAVPFSSAVPFTGAAPHDVTAWVLHHEDPYAANTADAPETVVPTPLAVTIDGATLCVNLPPLSWAYIELGHAKGSDG